jgi:uncharacterized protein with FMN-binding domain
MNSVSRCVKLSLLVVLAVAVFTTSPAGTANTPDVTGTWTMTVETPSGQGTPTFVLAQKDGTITGTYTGQFGEAPVTGTIKDNAITMTILIAAQGQEMKVDYIGTVDGDSMSGKVVFGSYGEGTFTGTRKKQ